MKQHTSTTTSNTAVFLLIFLIFPIITISSGSGSSPIKNVVVLVMENRSFDHMLGWMKALNPEINGVDGSESNPVNVSDPKSERVYFGNQSHFVDPDPGHSFQAIREQIFGSEVTDNSKAPPMNGFVQVAHSMSPNMTQAVMNGFLPDKVAVYKSLVSEFAVFDRWFASVPSSTQPNRLYVHSGTSHGATSNNSTLLAQGYPQRTIFDDLDDAKLDFRIYFQNAPAVLFYKSLRKVKFVPKFGSYDLFFKSDAKKGKLPPYSVIEQRYMDSKLQPATDDHPSHDVYRGQLFVKEIYEALRASPQWNQTMLVITYDEHGGFFDHVATPNQGVPSPDDVVGPEPFNFKFDRLGVRVPTIVVSPWIKKGTVVHGPGGVPTPTSEYEHSSIPATVRKIFNLTSPPLTKREAWAGTFDKLFTTLTEPRTDCPEQLPMPVKIREGEANEDAKLSEWQQELVQLAAALKGDTELVSYPNQIGKSMTVRQGNEYMTNAVKSFFEAGKAAKLMGVDEEQIVRMRPSLTTRTANPPTIFP